MGTLTGTDGAAQGAVVNGVTLGDPAEGPDGALVWDHGSIPDGDVTPVPTVEVAGKTVADAKYRPAKDYAVSAERADRPVAIRPRVEAVAVDVEPVEEPVEEEPVG